MKCLVDRHAFRSDSRGGFGFRREDGRIRRGDDDRVVIFRRFVVEGRIFDWRRDWCRRWWGGSRNRGRRSHRGSRRARPWCRCRFGRRSGGQCACTWCRRNLWPLWNGRTRWTFGNNRRRRGRRCGFRLVVVVVVVVRVTVVGVGRCVTTGQRVQRRSQIIFVTLLGHVCLSSGLFRMRSCSRMTSRCVVRVSRSILPENPSPAEWAYESIVRFDRHGFPVLSD